MKKELFVVEEKCGNVKFTMRRFFERISNRTVRMKYDATVGHNVVRAVSIKYGHEYRPQKKPCGSFLYFDIF